MLKAGLRILFFYTWCWSSIQFQVDLGVYVTLPMHQHAGF